MTMEQWFMDDEFSTPLPDALSEECARVYGRGDVGVSFAQGLAAFLAIEEARVVMVKALTPEEIHGEELAEMERRISTWHSDVVRLDLSRLIAALRAKHEELAIVRRLANDSVITLDAEREELIAALRASRAEVERLRIKVSELEDYAGIPNSH